VVSVSSCISSLDGTVMSVPIDLRRGKTTGSAVPLLDSIMLCRQCKRRRADSSLASGALA
jgi:hypothetical protein